MGQCWSADPHKRPNFNNLVDKLREIVDSDSMYLRL